MFLRKAALRPVPRWAMVDDLAIDLLEEHLGEGEEGLQQALDAGYREMDRLQPHPRGVARRPGVEPQGRARAVGRLLPRGHGLHRVPRGVPDPPRHGRRGVAQLAIDTLSADEELRANDPTEVLESDDVVAMGQPVLLGYVQHHFDEALAQADDDVDLEAFDVVYRAILVEVIALSHAVRSPGGEAHETVLA
ncbi:MAG: hypothetical protein M5U28_32550 [Sandaracinaceae bacterium]|nr:hypothetical protein [Sandaracinaceae bacterium]